MGAEDRMRTCYSVLDQLYRMANDEVQQPGNNDRRFRALIRIRDFAKEQRELQRAACEHQWDGERIPLGESGSVATCSRCGEAAVDLRLLKPKDSQHI
jgi:hypothetical protein